MSMKSLERISTTVHSGDTSDNKVIDTNRLFVTIDY